MWASEALSVDVTLALKLIGNLCLTRPFSTYVNTAGNPKQKLIYGKLCISDDTSDQQGSTLQTALFTQDAFILH